MTNILRWGAALPLAAIAAFAIHMGLGVAFGIAHGFNEVGLFWESRDMAGMPISGTYIMLVTRIATISALVGVAAWAVPRFKIQAGIVIASVIGVSTVALFVYTYYQSVQVGLPIGFWGWYRGLLEAFSIIIGCAVGIGLALSADRSSENA